MMRLKYPSFKVNIGHDIEPYISKQKLKVISNTFVLQRYFLCVFYCVREPLCEVIDVNCIVEPYSTNLSISNI